jgi:hypothetical protein
MLAQRRHQGAGALEQLIGGRDAELRHRKAAE